MYGIWYPANILFDTLQMRCSTSEIIIVFRCPLQLFRAALFVVHSELNKILQ